jgi:hypothetical protein
MVMTGVTIVSLIYRAKNLAGMTNLKRRVALRRSRLELTERFLSEQLKGGLDENS